MFSMQAKVIGGDVYKQCKNIQKNNALILSQENLVKQTVHVSQRVLWECSEHLVGFKTAKTRLLTEHPSHSSSQ